MATNLPLFIDNFIDEQDTRETITIQVAQPLRPDRQYKVSMSFVSFLNDELRGFYRSSYVEKGVTKSVLHFVSVFSNIGLIRCVIAGI